MELDASTKYIHASSRTMKNTLAGPISWRQASLRVFKKCKTAHFQHLTVQYLAGYSWKGVGCHPPSKASELAVYSSWQAPPEWCIPVSWHVPHTSHPPPHPSIFSLLSVSFLSLQPSLCCLLVLFEVDNNTVKKNRNNKNDSNLSCPSCGATPAALYSPWSMRAYFHSSENNTTKLDF